MRLVFSFALIVFCGILCSAQRLNEKADIGARQRLLKKQILVDDLDNQAKDIRFVAVRIYVRIRLAEWLWRTGKDETGRAELIAVKAAEELYEKENEVPNSHSLKTSLFSLLDVRAKETAQKLRTKYKVGSAEDLLNLPLTNRKESDKIAAEKIRKNLTSEKDLAVVAIALSRLHSQKSPELVSILFEIINVQESGRNNFTTASFLWLADSFRDSAIPNHLRIRYYKIILSRARNALQFLDASEIHYADTLLYAVLPDMTLNAPELAAEAAGLKVALSAKTSQQRRDSQERNKRIEESADKLDALISEAEKTDDKGEKYELLSRASSLAMKEEKFQLAVELLGKTIEDKSDKGFPDVKFRLRYYDQQLRRIAEEALKKDAVESAEYAAKKIISDVEKARSFVEIARYHCEKKDFASAFGKYDDALKLTARADNDLTKFYTLFQLISVATAFDQNRIFEATSITAKSIDKIPTLNVEDKPGTENFEKYVSTIMTINYNLYTVMSNLAKKNKKEATDFANQIDRNEIKIVADAALAIDAFEYDKKQPLK